MTMKHQQKKTANAVSGRTARACESCLRKRARWYCLADDAFLCQSCDSSVHSANELASRHKRVRLETASSFKKADHSTHRDHHAAAHDQSPCNSSSVVHAAQASSWHRRKPRTPRPPPSKRSKLPGGSVVPKKTSASTSAYLPLVPEIERDEPGGNSPNFYYEDEEEINEEAQMLFSVPVLDPFFTHDDNLSFYKSPSSSSSKGHGEGMGTISTNDHDHDGFDFSLIGFDDHGHQEDWDNYFPSDDVLAEFAAAAESCLLAGGGRGGEIMEEEKLGTIAEGHYENKYKSTCGLLGKNGINLGVCSKQGKRQVKVENRDHRGDGCLPVETSCNNLLVEEIMSADVAKDASNFNVRNYDHRSSSSSSSQIRVMTIHEEEKQLVLADKTVDDGKTLAAASTLVGDDGTGRSEVKKRREIFLSLNYEDVITAWAGQGSPWTIGSRPENIDPDLDGWPNNSCSMAGTTELHHQSITGGGDDGGREARVLRYREKRKNRLFSKKIRYQVRKINAEKRPRLKGRFIKRTAYTTTTTFAAAAASCFKQGY